MKTIKELLNHTKPHADNTKVELLPHVPLKKAHAYANRFEALGVVNVTIAGGAKAAVKKAKPKASAKKAVKKAATKKPTKAKSARQTRRHSGSNPGRRTRDHPRQTQYPASDCHSHES